MNERVESPMSTARRLTALLLSASLMGCGPAFVDNDSTAATALGLPTLLTIDGELNFDIGDETDWKRFTAQADGRATLEVRIGDPFEGRHNVRGSISVFDRDANQLVEKTVTYDIMKYQMSWDVEEEIQYLIRISATEGQAIYAVDLRLDLEASDPCDGIFCEEGEICEEGECVVLEGECDPPCSGKRECVDGECVRRASTSRRPCGGKKCPRGQFCSKSKDRCVKDPCHGKRCPSGKVCRRGVCKAKSTPVASSPRPSGECDPPCSDGATCKKGKCKYGPLPARIVQSVPRGETTVLTLNKGTTHKIKVGQSGKVSGVGSFKIIEAYEYRSKAILKAPASKLGDKKAATIYR